MHCVSHHRIVAKALIINGVIDDESFSAFQRAPAKRIFSKNLNDTARVHENPQGFAIRQRQAHNGIGDQKDALEEFAVTSVVAMQVSFHYFDANGNPLQISYADARIAS